MWIRRGEPAQKEEREKETDLDHMAVLALEGVKVLCPSSYQVVGGLAGPSLGMPEPSPVLGGDSSHFPEICRKDHPLQGGDGDD